MNHARIKLVYKYSEARLMLQSLSPLDLLGLGGRQGGTSIHPYHTTNIIWTMQESNLFTSILRLDLCYKAGPSINCWALEVRREGHPHIHITSQLWYPPHNIQAYLQTSYGLTKAIKLVPSNLMSLRDAQIWIFMQPYHITRNAISPLLVVTVMEDLINTVEKVGAKDRLECGFVQGEYGYVGGDDSNSKAGLFRLIFDLVISWARKVIREQITLEMALFACYQQPRN